jgi:hypothetical protein
MNADGTGRMRVREDATDDGSVRDTPQAMGSGLAVQQGSSVLDTSARFCAPAQPGFVNCGWRPSANSGRQPRPTHGNQLSAERVLARGEREKESSWFQE